MLEIFCCTAVFIQRHWCFWQEVTKGLGALTQASPAFGTGMIFLQQIQEQHPPVRWQWLSGDSVGPERSAFQSSPSLFRQEAQGQPEDLSLLQTPQLVSPRKQKKKKKAVCRLFPCFLSSFLPSLFSFFLKPNREVQLQVQRKDSSTANSRPTLGQHPIF